MNRFLIVAALACPLMVHAHEYKVGDLVIDHPVAFETTATAQSGAGYMTITNTGETSDRLLKVEADFPRVMLHETVLENDVATMKHLMGVDIPAGATVTFAPGGKHVMFMGLNGDPLEVGEAITSVLTFENTGTIEVVFNAEARDDAEKESDHSGH